MKRKSTASDDEPAAKRYKTQGLGLSDMHGLRTANPFSIGVKVTGTCLICDKPTSVDEGFYEVAENPSYVYNLCTPCRTSGQEGVHLAISARLGFLYATNWYGKTVLFKRTSGEVQKAKVMCLVDRRDVPNKESKFMVLWGQSPNGNKITVPRKYKTLPHLRYANGVAVKGVSASELRELNPKLPKQLKAVKEWNGLCVHESVVEKTSEVIGTLD